MTVYVAIWQGDYGVILQCRAFSILHDACENAFGLARQIQKELSDDVELLMREEDTIKYLKHADEGATAHILRCKLRAPRNQTVTIRKIGVE